MSNNKIICKTCNNKPITKYYYNHNHVKTTKHKENMKKINKNLSSELPGSEIAETNNYWPKINRMKKHI